ncbi:hypothetical protein TB1_040443 [Malus domestica]
MNTKKPTVRTRIAPRGTHMGLEMMMIGVQMTRPRTVAVTVRPVRRRRMTPKTRRVRKLKSWVELGAWPWSLRRNIEEFVGSMTLHRQGTCRVSAIWLRRYRGRARRRRWWSEKDEQRRVGRFLGFANPSGQWLRELIRMRKRKEETMRRLKCRMKVYINATRVDHLVKISVRGVYICL